MDGSTSVLGFLAAVTVRSLGLVGLAWAAILVARVKSASALHALWTLAVAGMLLLGAFSLAMPAVPVRVLHPLAPIADLPMDSPTATPAVSTPAPVARPRRTPVHWQTLAAALYFAGVVVGLARFAMGYRFTVRLVRASRPIDGLTGVADCDWISVPVTMGWLRPRILLPASWRKWEGPKLRAALAHERIHVARADWAIALVARINRTLFWFHPAAWWLERKLAELAEQACDDAALTELGDRDSYAQTLLDMAAAVRSGEGRLVWEAMAMAKASEVRRRMERILDESRAIPRGVSRRGWAIMLTCGLPLIYFLAVAQLAPAQQAETKVTATAQPDFVEMERFVAAHPDDLEARGKLVRNYYLYSIKHPRLDHIFWMIRNRPESGITGLNAAGIAPQTTALNDAEDYQTAARLWLQQIDAHPGDARVLANAARFFAVSPDNWDDAERLLLNVRLIEHNNTVYIQQLARLYANAYLSSANPAFTARAASLMQDTTDATLLSAVGGILAVNKRDEPAAIAGREMVARARQMMTAQVQPQALRTAAASPATPQTEPEPWNYR